MLFRSTSNKNVINQEPYGDLPTPTRTGYEFNGWYTDKTGETKVEATDNLELDESNLPPTQPQSQTLYAGWTANQYDVVFNDKLPDEYQEVEYIESTGTQYINTTIVFQKNDEIITKTSATSSKTYNTIYGCDGQLEVYFNADYYIRVWGNRASITSDSGNIGKNEIHDIRCQITSNITNPLIIFAYAPNGSYPLNGRIYNFSIIRNHETIYDLIPCYRKSDSVIGMFDIINNEFYENAGNGTFYKGNDIESEYHIVKSQQFTYDTSQNLNIRTSCVGYTFADWNTKVDGTGTSYTNGQSVSNLTAENNGTVNLYAEWEANKYKVKFNSNEGTGTMSDQQFTYDIAQNLTINSFTRDGYTFAGWNTNADGTGTSYTDGQSVVSLSAELDGQVDLYAQWTPNNYMVRFMPQRLPAEYQEVEYIQANGESWINIDFIVEENDEIYAKASANKSQSWNTICEIGRAHV